jgi:hypothetical protein
VCQNKASHQLSCELFKKCFSKLLDNFQVFSDCDVWLFSWFSYQIKSLTCKIIQDKHSQVSCLFIFQPLPFLLCFTLILTLLTCISVYCLKQCAAVSTSDTDIKDPPHINVELPLIIKSRIINGNWSETYYFWASEKGILVIHDGLASWKV